MAMTQTERVVRYLTEELKRQELPSRSRKYRKFTGLRPETFYWIGKNGAVRVGKASSNSMSLTDTVYARMRLWEAKEGK